VILLQRNRKRIAMIVAIFLAAMLILPILIAGLSGLAPEAQGSITQKDINDRKKELEALRANRQKTQAQIKELKGLQADVVQRKMLYDEQIANVELDMELTAELIAQLNADIYERQQELEEAKARENELQELYIQRVRAMESMGEISYLSILLQAESLTDFLTRWDAMREIMARDQKLAEDLLESRLAIEETITRLEEDKKVQNEHKRELSQSQRELAELSAETDAMMVEYLAGMAKAEAQLKDEEARIAKAQKEIEDMEAEWKKIQEELRKKNNKFVGGEYMWPVPGHTNISSGHGMRKHPVYKVNKHHTGIDIPAPKGTNIVAANRGEIILMTRSGGYGNYVVIDHGGGQATLYAHLSGFAKVKVGQQVRAGDVIGYIGSTGVSTGNHLHFEIRKNGTDVDPVPLLTGK
jgi:murein DD-endopeptidase MepM/ murein hydrolase activator NlpD